jgi:hypothetical protein
VIDDERLGELLRAGEIVRLSPEEKEQVLALVTTVEIEGASFPGGPVLLCHDDGLAALELDPPSRWYLRPLAGEDEARAFLARRREEHDRQWDGCGCRIDYESR